MYSCVLICSSVQVQVFENDGLELWKSKDGNINSASPKRNESRCADAESRYMTSRLAFTAVVDCAGVPRHEMSAIIS